MPNDLVHPAFGKVVFSVCDLLIGYLLYLLFPRDINSKLQRAEEAAAQHSSSTNVSARTSALSPSPSPHPRSGNQPSSSDAAAILVDLRSSNPTTPDSSSATLWISLLWLLNPFPLNISTRGSSESVLGALILSSLYLLSSPSSSDRPFSSSQSSLTRRQVLGSALLGLAVHVKIYPVVFAFAVLGWLGRGQRTWFGRMGLCRRGIEFGLVSGGIFGLVTAGCWSM